MSLSVELLKFSNAIFAGIFLFSFYYAIELLRRPIPHRKWTVDAEDLVYWILVGRYLFVQIHQTNNGVVRGYYVLGIVLGIAFSWKICDIFRKLWKKFVHPRKQKWVDKLKENR